MEPVTILTFNELEQAQAACKRLEEAGFHPNINDERQRQKHWLVSECLACFRVQVDKHEYGRADQLLDEWAASRPELLRGSVHCPECGSSEVEYPQFNRKFTLEPAVYALLTKVGLFEKKFYCHHCHYMWGTSQKLEPHTDILGWPEKKRRAAETRPTAGVR
jgi:transposase-like protein